MTASDSGKRTVMIVDDSDVVLEVAKETLEAAGYRVLTRNRPAGCIAMMLQEEPDLVLIDVSMPEVGGDTLVRCFGTAHPSSPAIMLLHSGLPEEALAQRAAASGAHGFIRKSADPGMLAREVRRWMGPGVDGSGQPLSNRFLRASSRGAMSSNPAVSGARRIDDQTPEREPAHASGTHYLEQFSVLLVDAEMLSLSQYRRQLHGDALGFDFALSAEQAWRRITSDTPPDVVVVDVQIGQASGVDFYLRALQRDPNWARRFVFISDDPDIFIERFRGVVLPKPPPAHALQRAVDECIVDVRSTRRTASG